MTNLSIEPSASSFEQRASDLITFSQVVNQFMNVPRATLREGRPETDGEHTLHLQFLAVAYAQEYHVELDVGKVSLYALIHDFIEVYAGDVNSLQATPEEISTKALTEKLAFNRLSRELGATWPRFLELIERYETLEEPEARFVKCFDKCDPGFSHIAGNGVALKKLGVLSADELDRYYGYVTARMQVYADEFPDVMALRDELHERTKQVTYPEL